MSRPATRSRLLSLLSEACELEHALACSYLYAAFSLKRDIGEGISWADQQRNRRWAGQIYHVAAQEMLHLAQAWNLLGAVGGSPYYARPNFPLPAQQYPLRVALTLRRFDRATLQRFCYYENPAHNDPDRVSPDLPPDASWPVDESFPFSSVGELYGEIRSIITTPRLDLFVADPKRQVGTALVDFFDIVEVTDRDSAVAAIARITLQGEGTTEDREDSHFGVFTAISGALERGEGDDAARPAADNPYVRLRRDQIPAAIATGDDLTTTEIRDQLAVHAIDLFDDTYVSMLQALAYVFDNADRDPGTVVRLARSSLELMTTVIKPLGEAICLLPSGHTGVNAGPTFAMSRHASLPSAADVATTVYGERLAELAAHGHALADQTAPLPPVARDQVRGAARNLERLAQATLDAP